MQQLPKNKIIYVRFALNFFMFAAFLMAIAAQAIEITPSGTSSVPCGVLTKFDGDVQIMDPSRSQLMTTEHNSPIACGGWVSVDQGWAEIHHRNGHHIRISSNTFIQILDSQDQAVLYKGQALLIPEEGNGEFRVITANARVRATQGTSLLIFNPVTEETQLTVLDESAFFENRFESEKSIVVHAGEASSLNFKLLRVVPTAPQVVAIASLRPKLAQMQLSEPLMKDILKNAYDRTQRKVASFQHKDSDEEVTPKRAPAAIHDAVYTRDQVQPTDPESEALHAHWVTKMTGSKDIGDRILYPDKFYGRPAKISVTIEDPAAGLVLKNQQKEDAEKRQLIEDLSKIRE